MWLPKIVQSLINEGGEILILRNICWRDNIYHYGLLEELCFLCWKPGYASFVATRFTWWSNRIVWTGGGLLRLPCGVQEPWDWLEDVYLFRRPPYYNPWLLAVTPHPSNQCVAFQLRQLRRLFRHVYKDRLARCIKACIWGNALPL